MWKTSLISTDPKAWYHLASAVRVRGASKKSESGECIDA